VAIGIEAHRPRNVDWKRAAALLYGDWGTSKAYVIGLAFVAAGFSSLPIIIAVCALTGLVGINYAVICRYFPDGGGVYSAARTQGRLLAVVGALLLVADLTVTAALSGWSALTYFKIPFLVTHPGLVPYATISVLLVMGWINWYGPKHSGSMAVALAAPTVIVVIALIGISAPHLTTHFLEPRHESYGKLWVQFVGVILALSGVEAIANLTGVMKLDPGSTSEHPQVGREAAKAIWPIAIEVVCGTALLGWAMLSLPSTFTPQQVQEKAALVQADPEKYHLAAGDDPQHAAKVAMLDERNEDMLRFVGEQFGAVTVAPWFGTMFGWIVGIVFFLLLLSAANTAIVALIGLVFMMARDGEMPRQLTRLNSHGVPLIPLGAAVVLPVLVLVTSSNFEALAGLYAIGVVGAITVNLGSCTFNRALPVQWYDRALFGLTFIVLFAVELTLAKTKPDALFFVLCVLGVGLGLRAYAQKRAGLTTLTVTHEVAQMVTPEAIATLRTQMTEASKIMVAARGITPVLRFALDEAQLRNATLCVLYVKELAVFLPGGSARPARVKWQDDPEANAIMSLMMKIGQERGVNVLPVYAVSEDPPATILDLSATLGVDYLIIGASHRMTMTKLLKGNVVEKVAAGLPEDIQLVIHG
jgi:amino acid transporter/nucleotide-binding universal stress UspA family protein